MMEFDPEKDRRNRVKHGVSLSLGLEIVRDPGAMLRPDRSMDYGEARWIAIGMVKGIVHVAIYTARGERVRMISVRRATRREADLYFRTRGSSGD